MFSDKKFNMVAKVDKYGNRIQHEDKFALQNYYSLEKAPKPQLSKLEKTGQKFYDADGNFNWQGESSSGSDGSEAEEGGEAEMSQMSGSSGSEIGEMSEQSDDVSGVWSEPEEPKDESKPQADVKVGKRIAVTNLDWDTINATDLLVLFSSFVRAQNKGGSIVKVQIYPSLFGIEQMKKERVEGPPKEMFSAKKKRRFKANPHSIKVNDPDYISDDDY